MYSSWLRWYHNSTKKCLTFKKPERFLRIHRSSSRKPILYIFTWLLSLELNEANLYMWPVGWTMNLWHHFKSCFLSTLSRSLLFSPEDNKHGRSVAIVVLLPPTEGPSNLLLERHELKQKWHSSALKQLTKTMLSIFHLDVVLGVAGDSNSFEHSCSSQLRHGYWRYIDSFALCVRMFPGSFVKVTGDSTYVLHAFHLKKRVGRWLGRGWPNNATKRSIISKYQIDRRMPWT